MHEKEFSMTLQYRFRFKSRLSVILGFQAILILGQAPAFAQPAVTGEWSSVFNTENVLIHANLLPNGKVLFWSRREVSDGANLNPHVCTTRILDPNRVGQPGMITFPANQPGYNLFCSGHTFLPDGRVFVVGDTSRTATGRRKRRSTTPSRIPGAVLPTHYAAAGIRRLSHCPTEAFSSRSGRTKMEI
jgi:hypothetical protein